MAKMDKGRAFSHAADHVVTVNPVEQFQQVIIFASVFTNNGILYSANQTIGYQPVYSFWG